MHHSKRVLPILLLLSFVYFLTASDGQLIIPLLAQISESLSTSPDVAGRMVSFYSLCAAIIPLLLAPIADTKGRKKFIIGAVLIFSAGLLFSYPATSINQLFVVRCLAGVGAGMLSMLILTYIGDVIPYENRGFVMGMVMSGYFAAMILGVPIGAYVAETFGWRMTFTTFGILAFVLSFPLLALLPTSQPQELRSAKASFRGLQHKGVFSLVIISFLDSGALVGFMTYIGVWLKDIFKLTAVEVSYLFITVGVVALIASPIAGKLADRVGKKNMLIYGFFIRAVCLFAVPFFTQSLIPIYIGFILLSLSAAFRMGPMNALITHLVEDSQRASTIALKNSMAQLGIAIGTWWAGILFVTWSYIAVGIFSAILALSSLLILFFTVQE